MARQAAAVCRAVAWLGVAASLAQASPLDRLTKAELESMDHAELVAQVLASRAETAPRAAEAAPPPVKAYAAALALPGGSYQSSCYDCTLVAEVLSCQCMSRSDILPSALPSTGGLEAAIAGPANLTGGWHALGGKTADGGGALQPSRLRLSSHAGSGGGFDVLCTDGGTVGSCQSYPPPQYNDGWYTASGHATAGGSVNLTIQLRSGAHSWSGKLNADGTRIAWGSGPGPPPPPFNPQPGPDPSIPPPAWARDGTDALQSAGTLTSISLGACTPNSTANITNRDGFLSCTWIDKPPPRVGPLTGDGFNTSEKTCRYIHHTTFTSPRYSNVSTQSTVALVIPWVYFSGLLVVQDNSVLSEQLLLHPSNHSSLAGTWSSLGNDGTCKYTSKQSPVLLAIAAI